MNSINFKGNFLQQVNIKKLATNGQYKPYKANFIELNHDDILVLENLLKRWGDVGLKMRFNLPIGHLLSPEELKNKMNKNLFLTKGLKKDEVLPFLSSRIIGTHMYAITKQKDNFKKLNTDDILGIVDFYAGMNKNEISQLHVRPDCISEKYGNRYFLYLKNKIFSFLGINNKNEKRQYSHVGASIVTTLQSMYNDKPMELISLIPAKNFYKKYGFAHDILSDLEYIWHPKDEKEI